MLWELLLSSHLLDAVICMGAIPALPLDKEEGLFTRKAITADRAPFAATAAVRRKAQVAVGELRTGPQVVEAPREAERALCGEDPSFRLSLEWLVWVSSDEKGPVACLQCVRTLDCLPTKDRLCHIPALV